MSRRAIWIVLLACSPAEGEVLLARDGGVVETCEQSFVRGREGDACTFTDACDQETSSCCFRRALCEAGRLFFGTRCTCDCADDLDCAWGELCVGGDCRACPEGCDACPAELVSLSRHGCRTCECGPRHQCTSDDACALGEVCVASAVCARGCDRVDCCAGVCAPSAASTECGRPPLGCAPERCDAGEPCHFSAPCTCEAGGWQCAITEGTPFLDACP
jgi:hypothetical protein